VISFFQLNLSDTNQIIWVNVGMCFVNESMNGTDEWYVINVYVNK
jgi:hypothetical protein